MSWCSHSLARMSNDDDLLKQFETNYQKVLKELDVLYNGTFDADEGAQIAALCLLTQAPLIKIQASAELRARGLKRDIEFKKAEVYSDIRKNTTGKLTESALQQQINQNADIHKLYQEQNDAEREAKELSNILALLKDAHITFRSIAKKGE